MTGASPRFAYGTNGFAGHRLDDAIAVLADLGYDGVAITLDHHHLDPFLPDLRRRAATLARRLDVLGLGVVVETGARYLLDPRHKHQPTLLSDHPEPRLDLLRRAVDIAAELGAEAVSLWSGALPPGLPPEVGWERLVARCAQVVAMAERRGVTLAFEPEPGMLVGTLDGAFDLWRRLGEPPALRLTLDVGHCRCNETEPADACVRRAAPLLAHVQIDDMRRSVHEHLEFGTGEVDFPPVLRELVVARYSGLIAVELPRHSHDAPAVAARSLRFLRAALAQAETAPAGR
ncbi:sugar phosphate isomerase/epimerase family protein [Actinoallomurus soli]|uniref:sugar phosphate isomerase/epimerase family protein n=1 Tax=Actinoallomurus soli TaxID=2952535 RepID=UPI0020927046|nr:sugar phosphate isomerase/epimerase family protein [Actinoallomurus soli]MCO5970795.1 sugar phosphate isomerase/epimerase [Actinoallomurus soli]